MLTLHLPAERTHAVPQTASISHNDAYQYVAAWAAFDHDSLVHLSDNGKEFFGTLGALDFQYSEKDHILHAWSLIMPGAGPFLTTRSEIKAKIDGIAQNHPEETAGAVFDIRTLPWNKQSLAKLEPRLYLRLDVADATVGREPMMLRFQNLARTGYVWHREKMTAILEDYWKHHPQVAR